MSVIKSVSDLRSYGDILSNVVEGSPVFLTRNGIGRYAILTMEDYDKLIAANTLMGSMPKAAIPAKRDGWLSADSVRQHFQNKLDADE